MGEIAQNANWSIGMYMAGFFPCMMFGIPGAALAMIRNAKSSKQKYAIGIVGSAAVCAFLCGVTEPFEFAFMFLAFPLYVVYSLLYGIFAAITDSAVLVVASFLIGFAASNHVLVQNGDHDATFISLVCGLVFAEIAWISYSWLIIYTIGSTGICISQLSLILSVLTYAYLQIHVELDKHGNKLKFANVALPVLFSILVIIVLIISFSQPRFNIH